MYVSLNNMVWFCLAWNLYELNYTIWNCYFKSSFA